MFTFSVEHGALIIYTAFSLQPYVLYKSSFINFAVSDPGWMLKKLQEMWQTNPAASKETFKSYYNKFLEAMR